MAAWRAWVLSIALSACALETEPEMIARQSWEDPANETAAALGADTVVVLPDTQFYACAYPDIFAAQTRWIAEQRDPYGLAVVLHTGDLVDHDWPEQWSNVARAFGRLRYEVPYLAVPGNHDIDTARSDSMRRYLDLRSSTPPEWRTTFLEHERDDDMFSIVELAGQPWLILGLEFGPRDAAVAWAGEVLEAHADLPAIVFTHAYLDGEGRRYDRHAAAPQPYHPDRFQVTPEEGINDGEDLWRKLIEPHENVRLVLSGHEIPDGLAHSVAVRESGSKVHQVLANFQLCDLCPCSEVEGGGGYLRLMRFDPSGTRVKVTTYSPYFDEKLRDAENEFELELELELE